MEQNSEARTEEEKLRLQYAIRDRKNWFLVDRAVVRIPSVSKGENFYGTVHLPNADRRMCMLEYFDGDQPFLKIAMYDEVLSWNPDLQEPGQKTSLMRRLASVAVSIADLLGLRIGHEEK